MHSLLSAHRNAGSFLDSALASPADMPTQTMDFVVTGTSFRSMVGQTVSHYRVLSCLGSGGMVYEAEDVKLCRRVAMKFLSAILHMKEYLELVPGSDDVRGSKGGIIIWKDKLNAYFPEVARSESTPQLKNVSAPH